MCAARVGFWALFRLNQPGRIGRRGRQYPSFRGRWGRLVDDRTGPYCAEPALYFRRARAAAADHRTAGRVAHADRHLPGNPDPRDRGGLELHRSAARPDVGAYRLAVPALADHDRQRYRAHRRQFLYRHRHRQDLLPAQRRYPHRQRPGDGDLANDHQAVAARRDPAADPQLQRFDRPDHPGCAVRRGAHRTESRRHRYQSVANAARHRAGRGHSLSRSAASSGRCRSI